MKHERRRVVFFGRVQGVGFRMTTVSLARTLSVRGTVRNREDGAVELIVEGPAHEIDTMASHLREHFGTFVRNVEQSIMDGTHTEPAADAGIRVIS